MHPIPTCPWSFSPKKTKYITSNQQLTQKAVIFPTDILHPRRHGDDPSGQFNALFLSRALSLFGMVAIGIGRFR